MAKCLKSLKNLKGLNNAQQFISKCKKSMYCVMDEYEIEALLHIMSFHTIGSYAEKFVKDLFKDKHKKCLHTALRISVV